MTMGAFFFYEAVKIDVTTAQKKGRMVALSIEGAKNSTFFLGNILYLPKYFFVGNNIFIY
jgi:hypothetical protein